MYEAELETLLVERKKIMSAYLKRDVIVDFYLPKNVEAPSQMSLLLINDGQDLPKMNFDVMLNELLDSRQIQPLLCVGIHAGEERKAEYGTAKTLDYLGRGAKAQLYNQFVLEELLPYVYINYKIEAFQKIGYAGFSLGGLTALDMVWNYPNIFSIVGVFSGSLWWRTKSLDAAYDENTDRIMHQQIASGTYAPGLKFYFTTGSLDETADRNKNGIIDSIDDTLALIERLEILEYKKGEDIVYINFEDGKHDVKTWGRAMPHFLLWGWSRKMLI